MKNIIFVCTGNTCRSPMAERICQGLGARKNMDIKINSRGILVFNPEPAHPYANEAVKKYGFNLEGHISRQFEIKDIQDNTIILTMTKRHKEHIINNYPDFKEQVHLISEFAGRTGDIIDPYGKMQRDYDFCAKQLYEIIENILEKL